MEIYVVSQLLQQNFLLKLSRLFFGNSRSLSTTKLHYYSYVCLRHALEYFLVLIEFLLCSERISISCIIEEIFFRFKFASTSHPPIDKRKWRFILFLGWKGFYVSHKSDRYQDTNACARNTALIVQVFASIFNPSFHYCFKNQAWQYNCLEACVKWKYSQRFIWLLPHAVYQVCSKEKITFHF